MEDECELNIDRIKTLEYGILDLDRAIDEKTQLIDELYDVVYIVVETAYDYAKANGDDAIIKQLSNEKKRSIEVKNRLSVIKEYVEAVASLSILEDEKREAEIELNADRRQFIREYCQNKMQI